MIVLLPTHRCADTRRSVWFLPSPPFQARRFGPFHAGHEIPSGHGAPSSLCATLFALALIQWRCDSTRGKGQVFVMHTLRGLVAKL